MTELIFISSHQPSSHPGETTQLGHPKPTSEGGSGGSSGSGKSGSSSSSNQSQGSSSGFSHDPRAESPMPDRTGFYAGMGALVGAVLGWASQFF